MTGESSKFLCYKKTIHNSDWRQLQPGFFLRFFPSISICILVRLGNEKGSFQPLVQFDLVRNTFFRVTRSLSVKPNFTPREPRKSLQILKLNRIDIKGYFWRTNFENYIFTNTPELQEQKVLMLFC